MYPGTSQASGNGSSLVKVIGFYVDPSTGMGTPTMDDTGRASCHPPPEQVASVRRVIEPVSVILSVNRGIWGEMPASLRSVRVAYDAEKSTCSAIFAPDTFEDDQEAMQLAGSSVAADFPDH